MQTLIHSLFFVREGRKRKLRIIQDNDSKVLVRFIDAKRNKEGKMEYVTAATIEVGDATAQEVATWFDRAMTPTSNQKK